MADPKTSHEAIEQLTPREQEVLRKRFGITDATEKGNAQAQPNDDGNGGSGGAPAAPTDPANP